MQTPNHRYSGALRAQATPLPFRPTTLHRSPLLPRHRTLRLAEDTTTTTLIRPKVSSTNDAPVAPSPDPTPAPLPRPPFFKLPDLPPRTKGLILLNGLTILMSTNWALVKDVETYFDPYTFSALRFGVAALAFLPVLPSALKDMPTLKGGIELGIWSALGYITQALALVSTDASRASFLSTFTVILVPIIAGFQGAGVSRLEWGAALSALVGVSLLEQGGSAPSIGDVWGLVSAAMFAVQMYRTECVTRELPSKESIPLLSVVVATIAACSIGADAVVHADVIAHYATHVGELPGLVGGLGAIPIVPVLFTGLMSTNMVLLMELLALQWVSSTDAAIVYSLEPLLGAGLAWAMLGERWGALGWVGAAIIIASSLVVQLQGEEQDEAFDIGGDE